MSFLTLLLSSMALVGDTSARRLVKEPKCEPLKNHLGVFGNQLLSELEKDADAADIVKLINLSEYAEGSDRMTFFMPSGDRAAKTLLSLTKGELGPLTSPHGSSEYKRELRQIVKNHIATGDYPKILNDNIPTMAWTSELTPFKKDGKVYLQSCENTRKTEVTTQAKYDTCAGTVHVVDDIMTPHSVVCAAPSKQCGGENWQGPSCCAPTANTKYHCVHVPHNLKHAKDSSYKQCQPIRDFKGQDFAISESGDVVPVVVKQEMGSSNDGTTDKATFIKTGHTTEPAIEKAPKETAEDSPKAPLEKTAPKEERIWVPVPAPKGLASTNGTLDEYITFKGIDYVLVEDKSLQQLIVEDLEGADASVEVGSLKECAELCSKVEACNVASFYQIGSEYPGGKNCWLKNANFGASMLSSCKPPPGALEAAAEAAKDPLTVLKVTTQDSGAAGSTESGSSTESDDTTTTSTATTEVTEKPTTAARSTTTENPTETVTVQSSGSGKGQSPGLFTGGLIGLTLILLGL